MSAQEPFPPSLAEIRTAALNCTKCPLSATRTQVVFGEGSAAARLMLLGEAPGATEDMRGQPFVGMAGNRLDALLAEAGIERGEAYVTNVVLCRPPGNRRPRASEIAACAPYFEAQLQLINPRVIVALGATATRFLLGRSSTVGEERKIRHEVDGRVIVPTFHPGALNRRRERREQMAEDLGTTRRVLDGGNRGRRND